MSNYISGYKAGVGIYNAAGSVSNSGTISASGSHGSDVMLENGGSVSNDGTISASGGVPVYLRGSGTLTNGGSIIETSVSGTIGVAVDLISGGSIYNTTGGIISATGVAIDSSNETSIYNAVGATISASGGEDQGVILGSGGTIIIN